MVSPAPQTLRAVSPTVIAAGVLVLLSLALPWTGAGSGSTIPGWYAPGSCIPVYDYDGFATLDCTAGFFSPGWSRAGFSAQPGYATGMRVFLAVGVVVFVAGLRRGARRLRIGGLAVVVAGLAVHLDTHAGQLVFVTALGLLWFGESRPESAAGSNHFAGNLANPIDLDRSLPQDPRYLRGQVNDGGGHAQR